MAVTSGDRTAQNASARPSCKALERARAHARAHAPDVEVRGGGLDEVAADRAVEVQKAFGAEDVGRPERRAPERFVLGLRSGAERIGRRTG
jgi:hypothetical protein